MTKHVVPLMKHGGAIVNMSSVNAEIALPGFVPYAVSKAAISQLTRNSALDLGKFNIRYCSSLQCTAAEYGIPSQFRMGCRKRLFSSLLKKEEFYINQLGLLAASIAIFSCLLSSVRRDYYSAV